MMTQLIILNATRLARCSFCLSYQQPLLDLPASRDSKEAAGDIFVFVPLTNVLSEMVKRSQGLQSIVCFPLQPNF